MPSDEEDKSPAASNSTEETRETDGTEEAGTEDDTPSTATVDVLRYGKGESAEHVTVPSGTGTVVIGVHSRDAGRSRLLRTVVFIALALVAVIAGTLLADLVVGVVAAIVVGGVGSLQEYLRSSGVPELVDEAVHPEKADERYEVAIHVEEPFEETGEGKITGE